MRKKKWLIAVIAALAAATPVLLPEAVPVLQVIERALDALVVQPDPADALKQCASNWSECPPIPSPEPSQRL